MKLNLREIMEVPGGCIPYETDLDTSNLDFPSVLRYKAGPHGTGEVKNVAGVLRIYGTVKTEMVCLCDRCGEEYECEKSTGFEAFAEPEGSDNPDAYVLEGDELDISEVLETVFILDMDTKFLCREDCRGVCPGCGRNLNRESCVCSAECDPRLAVLEQLLDNKEEE